MEFDYNRIKISIHRTPINRPRGLFCPFCHRPNIPLNISTRRPTRFEIFRRIRWAPRRRHHRSGAHLSRPASHVSAAEEGHRHADRVLSQKEIQSVACEICGRHSARGHRSPEAYAESQSGVDGHLQAGHHMRWFARQARRSAGGFSQGWWSGGNTRFPHGDAGNHRRLWGVVSTGLTNRLTN